MTLSGQQFWEFQQALLAAFPTIGMLEQLVRVRLEQNLHAIAGAGSLTDVTRDLITWVEAQGRVNDLLDGAETDNPGNADLKAFAAAYRLAVKAATAEPVDLSPWVTIRDQGAEGTVAAMSLVTAAEIVLARKERPAALSARYLFEKAKKHDESAGDGTYLETVIYV